jgi:hypothetical protein
LCAPLTKRFCACGGILGGFLACPTFVFLEFIVHAAFLWEMVNILKQISAASVGRSGNRRRPRFPARSGAAAAAEQVNLSWKKFMRHDYTRWHLIVLMPNNVWNSSGRVFSRLLKANNCA